VFELTSDIPLVLHAHVPKTAGHSVSGMFGGAFGYFHLHHLHPDPFFILSKRKLAVLLRINPYLKSITSHHIRDFPSDIVGRQILYVTFLREPKNAFLSTLRYVKTNYRYFSPEVQRWWPADLGDLSLRELAKAQLTIELELNRVSFSPQTRFFCSSPAMKQHGLLAFDPYGEDAFPVARDILKNFLLVGIVEHMEESVTLLRERAARFGIALNTHPLGHENRTFPQSDDSAWFHPGDEVADLFFELSGIDRELYRLQKDELLSQFRMRSGSEGEAVLQPGP
jgi:hypothetical protein